MAFPPLYAKLVSVTEQESVAKFTVEIAISLAADTQPITIQELLGAQTSVLEQAQICINQIIERKSMWTRTMLATQEVATSQIAMSQSAASQNAASQTVASSNAAHEMEVSFGSPERSRRFINDGQSPVKQSQSDQQMQTPELSLTKLLRQKQQKSPFQQAVVHQEVVPQAESIANQAQEQLIQSQQTSKVGADQAVQLAGESAKSATLVGLEAESNKNDSSAEKQGEIQLLADQDTTPHAAGASNLSQLNLQGTPSKGNDSLPQSQFSTPMQVEQQSSQLNEDITAQILDGIANETSSDQRRQQAIVVKHSRPEQTSNVVQLSLDYYAKHRALVRERLRQLQSKKLHYVLLEFKRRDAAISEKLERLQSSYRNRKDDVFQPRDSEYYM